MTIPKLVLGAVHVAWRRRAIQHGQLDAYG